MANGARGFSSYLALLRSHGAKLVAVMAPPASDAAIASLHALPGVSIPDGLERYFRVADGCDADLCAEFGVFEPTLAWRCFAMSARWCAAQYRDIVALNNERDEDWADYWPLGFVPILYDGAGDFMVVNCRAGSPTQGAVYDMTKGVGCTRVSASLDAFFNGCAEEVRRGLTVVDARGLLVPDPPPPPWRTKSKAWDDRRAAIRAIYGETPYFARRDFVSNVVDWR